MKIFGFCLIADKYCTNLGTTEPIKIKYILKPYQIMYLHREKNVGKSE